jgi:hypothetical protein
MREGMPVGQTRSDKRRSKTGIQEFCSEAAMDSYLTTAAFILIAIVAIFVALRETSNFHR